MQETLLAIPCPICGSKLYHNLVPLKIPYFGEIILTTVLCKKCEYKTSDTIITGQKGPTRYEFVLQSVDDLHARVVRSSSATIKIPELGVVVNPGPRGEAFVSNTEGVLERVKSAVTTSIRFAKKESQKKKGKQILRKIERLKEGKEKATLIIEDPYGNSAIISKLAKKRKLSPSETKKLELLTF